MGARQHRHADRALLPTLTGPGASTISSAQARTRALERLAGLIVSVERLHPVRVAVDGRSGAGKSTLAAELVVEGWGALESPDFPGAPEAALRAPRDAASPALRVSGADILEEPMSDLERPLV